MASLKGKFEYSNHLLLMVCGGISQMGLKAFKKELLNWSSHSFEIQYEKSLILNKVLKQCLNPPGDLHGGGFHCLNGLPFIYFSMVAFCSLSKLPLVGSRFVDPLWQNATNRQHWWPLWHLSNANHKNYVVLLYHTFCWQCSAYYDFCKLPDKLAVHLAKWFLWCWINERLADTMD